MFKRVFEELPLLTLAMTDLGNVVLTPNDKFAHLSFPTILMTYTPTDLQLNALKLRLTRNGGKNIACDLSDRSLRIALDIAIPKIFPVLRVRHKMDTFIKEVATWVEPFTFGVQDAILGKLRLCDWQYEGKLQRGQSDIATNFWIDVFIESSERPAETELNIRRTSQFVESWLKHKPKIDAEINASIYPEYHRYCDDCKQSIRHDEAGFWNELSIVSIMGNLDGTIVVRYHAGDLFGERRVQALVSNDKVTCEVTY